MKKKKVLSLVLALCMALAMLPTAALATEAKPTSGKCGKNATWHLDANGTLTISGTGAMDDYNTYTDPAPWPFETIRKVVIEDGISQIGTYSFVSRKNMASVSIPNSVTSIGDNAFSSCSSLTSVTIPSSMAEIGEYAFSNCTGLTSVTISSGVKVIGGRAFYNCTSLTGVTIPDSVAEIEYNAFAGCESLSNVTIPEGLVKIGSDAFYGTPWLKNKPGDFPVENGMLLEYRGKDREDSEVIIPEGVRSIGSNMFDGCKADSVTIPSSVTMIEGGAFGVSYMTTLRVAPNNQDYTSLDGVLFTKSMETLVAYPSGKAGSSYSIPNSVTEIEDYAFAWSPLSGVTIPDGVTRIGARAFAWCTQMTNVTIPGSVTGMGMGAFRKSGLRSATIKDGVTSIGAYVFSECFHLSMVTIPSSVTSIGEGAFWQCFALKSITIPDSVTTIEGGAFAATGLTSVTVPKSVTSIAQGAFQGCSNLKDIYYAGSQTQWNSIIEAEDDDDSLKNVTIHFSGATPSVSSNAVPTNDKLTIDGKAVTPTAYKIDGANYFQLRDVAMLLNGTKAQFSVDYDSVNKAVKITTGQPYTPNGSELKGATGSQNATVGNNDVYINGVKTDLMVYKINGANYFKLRDLGEKLGFNVGWKQGTGVFIESDKLYNPDD